MKATVLITGVNGFLGGGMWEYLSGKSSSLKLAGADIIPGLEDERIWHIDLTCERSLEKMLTQVQPDIIIHCAGGRMSDEEAARLANLGTTESLCAALHELGMTGTRVVIPGSAAEYGIPAKNVRKIREDVKPRPQSEYGQIKWEQTRAALGWAKKGLHICVGRIFNITGAGTPESLAAGRFAQQIALMELRGKSGILQTYDLSGKRDFIDIQDVCAALWMLARHGESGEVYNICSGRPTGVAELLERLIMCSKMTDVTIDEQGTSSPSFNVIGSAAKIKRAVGWEAQVALDKSLRQTLHSWRRKVRG